jgi:hypothetical protein
MNVTFDASESTDDVCIVGYEWDFGDGTNGTGKITMRARNLEPTLLR